MRNLHTEARRHMLQLRFRRGRKLVEARYLFSARGGRQLLRRGRRARRLMEGTLGGAIAPGRMVRVIRRQRRSHGFSGDSHRRRSRLSRSLFGRIRQQRLEGALGAISGPIVHMIGRQRRSFGCRHLFLGDGRKLRHGAGLGAALFQHVRRFVVGRRHVMRRDNTQTGGHDLNARFGNRGKIVEGWYRWRRGVHGRACGRCYRRSRWSRSWSWSRRLLAHQRVQRHFETPAGRA